MSEMGDVAGQSERPTESAQLMSGGSGSRQYTKLNLVGNVAALSAVSLIMFYAFREGATLFSFHPLLMSIGWLIFMTSAVNAVTPGDFATEWMPIRLRSIRHWIIQLMTLLIVFTGFAIIIANKIVLGKSHFVTVHAIFGLSAVIFMFYNSLGGVLTLYAIQFKHRVSPAVTKMVHTFLGILTFSIGIIAIILGLFHQMVDDEVGRYVGFGLVVIVALCTLARPCVKLFVRVQERVA